MKLPHGYRICFHCRRRYRVCRFNARHQDYCSRAECQLERKRKRDRERYCRKYHAGDKAFCIQEKARRSVFRRQKSELAEQSPGPPVLVLPVEPALASQVQRLSWMITGFMKAFSGESDPVFIQELASSYEASGQRLG